MRFCCVVACCLVTLCGFAGSAQDSLLNRLTVEIGKRESYLREKLSRIEALKTEARQAGKEDRLALYEKIYTEYKSFIYDSAFRYSRKLQDLAYELGDREKAENSRIKLAFVLVSSGLFNEALDTLRHVEVKQLDKEERAEYYYLMARTAYDLSDFNRDDFYSSRYNDRGNHFMDSAMALYPESSSQYLLMKGLKLLHLRDVTAAQAAFEKMITSFKLSDGDYAVAASTLSFIYFYNNQPQQSRDMLIRAAIADIRSCTKETLAMLNLAERLFKEGDLEHAYEFVKIAMEDANFYGARHRKIQVAAVFPIIEGQRLSTVESQRKALFLYASLITLLTVITLVFAYIIFTQFRRLKAAEKIISDANTRLQETNHQLMDANKIKEEYIWYYFMTTADHITQLDALKKSLDLKLMTKKQEDIRFIVDSINIKREREDLYHNFDKVFLKLFPDFVTVFNSFFKEEDKVHPKDDHLLNTELRIFALIRMGIHDNEKIARILDYSVTTIYTYKTRIRSKSILENDAFDREIMNIRAI